MAFDLKGRKVSVFRCHIDPVVGGSSKNAFALKDFPGGLFELTPIGVYVKIIRKVPGNLKSETFEHVIPYANVQSIQLAAEDERPAVALKAA